ncbi:MAG TPA: hypothetical protein VK558_14730 [Patescibacteria group bacterium]|nr:hypothetical protein [Patescibacteria group bacterium]
MSSFRRIAWFISAAFTLTPLTAHTETVEAHLASYKSKAAAERGWTVLTDSYSSVLYFHPTIREVDLPGKGHYFRLYAEGDQDMMATLCRSMAAHKPHKLDCTLRPITP